MKTIQCSWGTCTAEATATIKGAGFCADCARVRIAELAEEFSNQSASSAWDRWIGQQTPDEFAQDSAYAGDFDVALADYLAECPEMFGLAGGELEAFEKAKPSIARHLREHLRRETGY